MPFTPVAAGQIDLLQNAVDGDVYIPSFSRRSFLNGGTSGLLSLTPPLTLIGNLLTVSAPSRSWSMATFAGLGLTLNTSTAAGAFPEVSIRTIQSFTTAATSHLYAYPPNMRIGQMLVVAVATAALTTITTPGGWTLGASQAGTESRLAIYSRVITGAETGEILTFGTASGCLIRSWCIDVADGTLEVVSGLNDSAAGTSLDLATISPTWSVAEATNNLYLAVLGLANDVNVSGFPAGYTVTGQDANVSGTANIDCALAYAERAALGSAENPAAFTYVAARSTGHIIAIRPKVAGRIDWDGLTVRKNTGADVGTRRRLNLIEGSGVTLTIADDGTEIDVTIAASGGSAHVFRDDGVDMTQRSAANFVTTTTIAAVLTDDLANNETEVAFQLVGFTGGDVTSSANSLVLTIANNAVTNAKAADMAANTVKVNNTAGSTDPVDMAVSTNNFVGRLAANIVSMTGTQATTILDVFTSALKGLAPASGGGTTNFLRADGTWAVPVDTLTLIRDDGVNATARAALNFTSSTTISAVLTDDAGNNETEVSMQLVGFTGGDITSSANSLVLTIANNAVTNAKAADMAANTIKANPTAGSTDPSDLAIAADSLPARVGGNLVSHPFATLFGTYLSYAAGVADWIGLDVRVNTGSLIGTRHRINVIGTSPISVAAADDGVNDEVDITISIASIPLTSLTTVAALSVIANATNAVATPTAVASSADDTVFRRTATTLNWGQLTVGMAPNDVWTYAKIQNVSATSRFLGRITAGAGDIEELTGTQATTLLDVFTSVLKGLAPASGGGTTNFLRADGTWQAPPGTGTGGHVIRDDDVGMTQRAALNFRSSTTISAILTDDSGGGETEVAHAVISGSIDTIHLANDAVQPLKIGEGEHVITGAGPHNDVAIADTVTTVRVADTCTITGFAGGWKDRPIDIIADGGVIITLGHVTGSAAGNQITCPGDTNYTHFRAGARLRYDTGPATDIWRVVSTASQSEDRRRILWREDFDYELNAASTQTVENTANGEPASSGLNFTVRCTGTGSTTATTLAGIANHPGIYRISTNANADSAIILQRGLQYMVRGSVKEMEFILRMPTVTSIFMRCGFSDGDGIANTMDFFFDTAIGANVRARTASTTTGLSTITDTGVAPGTGFNVYTIRQFVSGTIVFLIDDVIVATHTTNVPATGTVGGQRCEIENRSAATRNLDVDYFAFESHVLGARTS